ncbi:MAG: TonB-dependent receptor [Burkholderiaceae bacterium]
MSFRVKPIVHGLALAFSGLAVVGTTAFAQTPPSQTQQQLERITITGSNIRRTDTETVAPVTIITREQIERSGSLTVAEVLQKLPANTAGVFSEYANSFAPGATGASLRGLGQSATLTLINGRRVAGYGFAQNIQDTFVDLNQIPASAVERIEILRDGASAIYGSDALAGVVNVILRRDFKGVEVGANYSWFESSNEYRANIVAGYGDLGSQRFNVFGVLDYYKRDGLTMADTEYGRTRDFRSKQGGRNFQSLTGGGTWVGTGPAGSAAANTRRAYAECAAPVNYQQAVALGLLPVNQSALALGTGVNQPGNTWCSRDFANVFSVIPETERVGFLGKATVDFAPNVQGFAEFGYSHNTTDFTFQEPFFAGTTRLSFVPGTQQLRASPFNALFAPGSGGNPLSTNATYSGVLNDLGTRDTNIVSDQYRILVGARYSIRGWDFDSAASYSRSDIDQKSRSLLTAPTIAALAISPAIQPPTPLSTSSLYNLNRPSLNSAALRGGLVQETARKAESELKMIDTKVSGELGTLPGGAVGLALGIEYRDESINSPAGALASSGGILGQGSTSVIGSRDAIAGYGELALPLTRQVEAQAALRYDHYSDFGSELTPKLGIKIKPTPEFLIRANWGRGFKAPSLPEISPSSAFFFTTITEPLTGAASQIAGSINANPNLRPEKSTSATAGIVFEPNQNFSLGIDYYRIKRTDQVVFEDFQALADNPNSPPATVLRDPVTGFVLAINGQYINLGKVLTDGFDFDVRYKMSTLYGQFGTRLTASYVNSYKLDGLELVGSNLAGAFINANTIPRIRGQLSQDWERGPWVVQATVNYIDNYRRALGSSTFFGTTGATAGTIPQNGFLSRKADSFTTLDLFGRYNITPKLAVTAAVLNVFDELPPYDPGLSTTYFFDRTTYDVRGRIFRVGVRYTFL